MSIDKAAAMAVINAIEEDEALVKLDQTVLSTALDDLFAIAGDRVVRAIDYHGPYGGPDYGLEGRIVTIWLMVQEPADEHGNVVDVNPAPSRQIPLVA